MNTSLGLLEVVGLALAIKAADTMAKAANITISGIERTKGSGWMLIAITGDVAAVNSALANGAELARRENGWVADRTIARPADALASWFNSNLPAAAQSESREDIADTDGTGIPAAAKESAAESSAQAASDDAEVIDAAPAAESSAQTTSDDAEVIDAAPAAESSAQTTSDDDVADAAAAVESPAAPPAVTATCNLCHDPACPRRKGEPRASCIHDGERGSV